MKYQPRYKPGEKIGGRYQVHKVLMGGMGEIYLCLNSDNAMAVALKTFQSRRVVDPQFRQQFKSEAANWIALEKHPNIVRCLSWEVHDNQPFIILEWILGSSLRGLLKNGPLSMHNALSYAIDICRGLVHVQEKRPGMVHADLKPENMLIDDANIIKITDFGLARVAQNLTSSPEQIDNTRSLRGEARSDYFRLAGTPIYMAPEQWLGHELDPRTDIYAIGCMLYEMFSGRPPFVGNSIEQLRQQHLEISPKPLGSIFEDNSPYERIIRSCLTKQIESRIPSVTELMAQLIALYEDLYRQPPHTIPNDEEYSAIEFLNRGRVYHELGQFEAAIVDYNRSIEMGYQTAVVYSNRGNSYCDLKRYDDSIADFDNAIQLDPTLSPPYGNRARVNTILGKYDLALQDYSRAMELSPNEARWWSYRSLVFDRLGDLDKALGDANQAITLDPTLAVAYNRKGIILTKQDSPTLAISEHDRAIELDPAMATAYFQRGKAFQLLERYSEAMNDYNQALQFDPILPSAYQNRGVIYFMQGKYDKAFADFASAISLEPNNIDLYQSRAHLCLKLGRFADAEADYRTITQIEPEGFVGYINLAMLAHNTGNDALANDYFQEAVKRGLLEAKIEVVSS